MTWATLDSVLTGFQKLSAAVFASAIGLHVVTPEAYQTSEGLAATGVMITLAGLMAVHGRADERSMAKKRLSLRRGNSDHKAKD